MGKKQKRGNAGLEATFIGRSKALKILQVTIKDFRRLCILKGIYPREPRGRAPGKKKGQTFYHIKDIRAIAHEPILEKFREFRSFMKKIRRAAGRNESDEAARKNAVCPSYTLQHLVRERYPRFVDALSDLDDALTLTYLFAALPSTTAIKAKMGGKAKSLAAAWGAYCSTAGCITKSFISVKGVYLEATIRGVPVRWVVPHSFTQFMPEDVDYKVMATFFEFYETLLNFVLFKLYSDLGVRYPLPEIEAGGEVALESMEEDKVRSLMPSGDAELDDDAIKRRRLFSGFTFFLSREVPRGYLELISLAYGAKVGWDGPNSPISVKDASITHHVVDRPKLLSSYDSLPKSREYVQPQWILDCSNFMFLLPIDKYGVGKALPPHLSPWVDNEEEGYKPAYAEEIERLKNGEMIDEVEEEEDNDSVATETSENKDSEEAVEADANSDESEEESDDEVDPKKKKADAKKKKARAKKRREQEEKEAHELAKSMMSRKAAHLYGRMQHGISKKQAKIDALENRRRDPLQNKEKDDDGKSMSKQKVERLKRERKAIEDLYTNTGGSMKKNKKKRKST
eukprot:jgi/Psemu1/257086/estExt_Genewise1Plus.C_2100010